LALDGSQNHSVEYQSQGISRSEEAVRRCPVIVRLCAAEQPFLSQMLILPCRDGFNLGVVGPAFQDFHDAILDQRFHLLSDGRLE